MKRTSEDDRVCILGMGYVGLTLAAVLADRGCKVVGVEIDPKILASISNAKAHFFEVNLDMMLRRTMNRGNLRFCAEIPADEQFDVYVITVGTPLNAENRPRMDMVRNVAGNIAAHMQDGALVILRSTVRLGTSEQVVKPILNATGRSYDLAVCPERTVEGKALTELRSLPQVVGGETPRASERAMKFFRRITPTIVEVSSLAAAELIKLLDNSYRDVFFSFGNQVALICESLGLVAHEVVRAANIGYERTNIAQPGFVGGPCLEKDPHILIDSLKDKDFDPTIIRSGRELNEYLVGFGLKQALGKLDGLDRNAPLNVSLMGLAFKGRPDTDDLRGSPALLMLRELREALPNARIRAQDYLVSDERIRELGLEPVDDEEAFRDAQLVLVLNNNIRYERLDVEPRVNSMARPSVVADFWNNFAQRLDLPEGVRSYVLGG